MEEYICKYCGKKCKNKNSLSQHEIRCKENPNKINTLGKFNCNGHPAWNKGLTKYNDKRIAKSAETIRKRYESGEITNWIKGLSKETDERVKNLSNLIKKTTNKKIVENTWHNSFSKARTQTYKGIKMMGNWEVEFAKILDKKNIKWVYTKDKFDYLYNKEIHKYNPDFYLSEFDTYVEIKGYPTKRDYAKWSTSNINNLNVFFGDDLLKLGLKLDIKENTYKTIPGVFRVKNKELLNKLMN